MWTTGRVKQANVDSVVANFDLHTPADPSKGIYQTDVDAYGTPPDVDNDPRIIILMMNIRDGFDGGGYIMGYFYGLNEALNGTPKLGGGVVSGSNEAEIYFLDANPTNLNTTSGLQDAMSTMAHEFCHMIQYNYSQMKQDTFILEGLSLAAEVNCGYPIYDQYYYALEPNHYLMDFRTLNLDVVLDDYSRAARFFEYLHEQFTMSVMKPLAQTTFTGTTAFSYALNQVGTSRNFQSIVQDWTVANVLNDRTVDAKYGYTQPGMVSPGELVLMNPNSAPTQVWVQRLAASYISYDAGSNLSVTASSSSAQLAPSAVRFGSPNSVVSLTSGNQYAESGFGSTYPRIDLVLTNKSETDSILVNLTSSGQAPAFIELAHTTSEPAGYLQLNAGDTAAVVFDGVTGATLDSIRVALRRATSIVGGVWKEGSSTANLLGTPLVAPFTVIGKVNPSTPYPVPWTNWVTVDLHTSKISAASPFAVGFAYSGVGTADQRLMIAKTPIADGVNSYTYNTEAADPTWYYLTTQAGDSLYSYLIKAYVSFTVSGVTQSKELLPSSLALAQNYPNPFNPSTRIQYDLPTSHVVRLRVYDNLGRQVAELVNGIQSAGHHEVAWNGRLANGGPAPSGTYFYQIDAGGSKLTRRMVLVK